MSSLTAKPEGTRYTEIYVPFPNRAINATSGLNHFVKEIKLREAHLRVIANPLAVINLHTEEI